MTPAEAATTASAPEPFRHDGRPETGAAVARTEELYARHRRLVSGLCGALLRDRAEAEDAAQQTFLAAHRALLNGSTPREPAAWLATIARNECWSRIRARMREPLPTDELDTQSFAADPLTEAIRRADLAALWRAISELPRQQRDALLLREFSGLSYDELAGALAVTGPAVESLLFRARQGVRARLQTAYATLSGVGWVETLLRLLAGASSSAAPVAAKAVAVVGVGAAVATGGVVVAPQMFDHHRRTQPQPATHAPRHLVQAVPVDATAAPVAPPQVFAAAPARNGDEGGSSSAGDEARASGSGESGDERQTLASGRERENRKDSGDLESRSAASAPHTESGSSGSEGSHGSGDSGEGSPDGGEAQPPAASGGLTVPVPNPIVTVETLTGDEPPAADG